ncbi:MAG: glycosyltransferase family protein [Ignavibacteria bacterium]|nr:glycosyltransferase family protein [Ignavibacteria bacterium]
MSNTAFVAARMGSERMPGKVIKELAGIPSLVHIFNILKESKRLDDFAVVTTALKEDDVLESICRENSVKIFRGSVHDVLDRFRIAAEALKPDRIIRVTGDDPLMDPEIIDKIISEHLNGDYDYSSNMVERTYPRGMDTEVIEYESLQKSWRSTSDKDDREHVTLFIRNNPEMFKIHSVRKEGKPLDDLRLCLDTEEDLKLISEIYSNLYKNHPIRLNEITEFLDKNPRLKNINSNIKQKSVKGKVY